MEKIRIAQKRKVPQQCLPRHFYNHSDVLYLFINLMFMIKTSSQQTVIKHSRFNSFNKSCNQYKNFHYHYSS